MELSFGLQGGREGEIKDKGILYIDICIDLRVLFDFRDSKLAINLKIDSLACWYFEMKVSKIKYFILLGF